MVDFEFGLDSFYSGWKPVCKEVILEHNQNIKQAEYFNSFIYQQYNGMKYKSLDDGEIAVIRLVPIMGNYNAIRYCGGYGSKSSSTLSYNGFTLRGSDITEGGKPDDFGSEFVYDANELIMMHGKKFERIRNTINTRKYNNEFSLLFEEKDILLVINEWSKATNSKHQIKLFEFIKKNKELCNFLTVYTPEKEIIGISIVEKINETNGVIIQQLINPLIKDKIKEPNILIHFYNCLHHSGMKLNIGGARNEQIRVAKSKLQPSLMLPIYRKISTTKKLSKTEYELLKHG